MGATHWLHYISSCLTLPKLYLATFSLLANYLSLNDLEINLSREMSLNTMIMSQYDFTSRFKVLPVIEACHQFAGILHESEIWGSGEALPHSPLQSREHTEGAEWCTYNHVVDYMKVRPRCKELYVPTKAFGITFKKGSHLVSYLNPKRKQMWRQ